MWQRFEIFGPMSSETFPNSSYFQSNTCNHSLWFFITLYNTVPYIITPVKNELQAKYFFNFLIFCAHNTVEDNHAEKIMAGERPFEWHILPYMFKSVLEWCDQTTKGSI